MNKQLIEQLAEQAHAHANSEYNKYSVVPDYSGIPHFREIYTNKLVELVIAECCRQVLCSEAEYIKQHFGVTA